MKQTKKAEWEERFEKEHIVPNGYITQGTGLSRYYDEEMAEIVSKRCKTFIRQELSRAVAERTEEIRKIIQNMKEDDRPEITVWLISKDYTKGYNMAIDAVLSSLTPQETEWMTCEACKKKKPDVSIRNCVYHKEINETEVKEIICDDCEDKHLMDI